MPASIDDYFRNLLERISNSGVVRSSDLNFDKRSTMLGLVRGQIYFIDGSLLHIRELIDLRSTPIRVMYVYHFQDPAGALIFRYDNSAHHPELPNFPHHKHTRTDVIAVSGDALDLNVVLAEVVVHPLGFFLGLEDLEMNQPVYLQTSQATYTALDRYQEFANGGNWDIGGKTGKIKLYSCRFIPDLGLGSYLEQ